MRKEKGGAELTSQKKKLFILTVASVVLVAVFLAGLRLVQLRQELNRTRTELEKLQAEYQAGEGTGWPTTKVALYFIQDAENTSFLVPEVREIPFTENPELAAIQELIKGPSAHGLQPVLPPKTKVRSLGVKQGLAVLDLSTEATKISRGSWGEALVVWAIVNTLTKFPGVEAVQILIEGNPVETLAGHFDLSRPLRRNEQVIRDEWTR